MAAASPASVNAPCTSVSGELCPGHTSPHIENPPQRAHGRPPRSRVAVRGQYAPPSSGCRSARRWPDRPAAGMGLDQRSGRRLRCLSPAAQSSGSHDGCLGELLVPPCCAVDTSRSGCDSHGSQSLRTPAAPSEKSRDGVGGARGGHPRISGPDQRQLGSAAVQRLPSRGQRRGRPSRTNGVRPEPPWHAGRVLGVRARRRRPRRLCTLVQARSDSLLRAPGPTRHTPVGPGYVPHAGDAPASAPGPRAREPARRSGNVLVSPAPDRHANRRPARGGFRP